MRLRFECRIQLYGFHDLVRRFTVGKRQHHFLFPVHADPHDLFVQGTDARAFMMVAPEAPFERIKSTTCSANPAVTTIYKAFMLFVIMFPPNSNPQLINRNDKSDSGIGLIKMELCNYLIKQLADQITGDQASDHHFLLLRYKTKHVSKIPGLNGSFGIDHINQMTS